MNELNAEIELVQDQIQQVQLQCSHPYIQNVHHGVCVCVCVCVCVQVREEIERFKGQGVEMEEKRKAILRDLEVRGHLLYQPQRFQ